MANVLGWRVEEWLLFSWENLNLNLNVTSEKIRWDTFELLDKEPQVDFTQVLADNFPGEVEENSDEIPAQKLLEGCLQKRLFFIPWFDLIRVDLPNNKIHLNNFEPPNAKSLDIRFYRNSKFWTIDLKFTNDDDGVTFVLSQGKLNRQDTV